LDARSGPESSLQPLRAVEFTANGIVPARAGRLHETPNKAVPGVERVSATISEFVSDAKQSKRFFVSGFVQGVGYRYFARDAAERLHLSGYVRNLRDGRVEAYAIGTPKQLADFRAKLERGPWSAHVTQVTEEPAAADPKYAQGFVIAYDG